MICSSSFSSGENQIMKAALGGRPRLVYLARMTKTMGASSFAFFAKGGSRECRRKFVDPCRVVTYQIARSIAAHPCKKRKDGAPFFEMAHAKLKAGHPPKQDIHRQWHR